jgi:hypothetical protein
VATTGAARAKEKSLPRSATITIRDQKPRPPGEVEVTPDGGRIHFHNRDQKQYRLRFWKVGTESEDGIDILLPAKGRFTVMIKKGDEFHFSVIPIVGGDALNGIGGGPIRN